MDNKPQTWQITNSPFPEPNDQLKTILETNSS